MSPVSHLLHLLKKTRWHLITWAFSSTCLGISSAAIAFLVGPLLRIIFGGEELAWSPLLSYCFGTPPSVQAIRNALPWLIAMISIMKATSFYCERVYRGKIARSMGRSLRLNLLIWSEKLDLDQRLSLGHDDLRQRLTVDVERVERWLEGGAAALLRDGLQVIFLTVSLLVAGGWIGLVILTIYPLAITPIFWAGKRLKDAAKKEISSAHQLGRWGAYVEGHLGRSVCLNQHDELTQELRMQHHLLETTQSRLAHLQGIAPSFTELSVSLVIALSLAGFISGLDAGWWSAEELMSLFVCILMLYTPVKSLGRAQQQWATGLAALVRACPQPMDRNLRLPECYIQFDEQIELTVQKLSPLRGDTFLPIEVSFTAKGGDLVLISGANGSGKSSILATLSGQLQGRGEVRWRGRQGRELTLHHSLPNLNVSTQPPRLIFSELSRLRDPTSSACQLLQSLSAGQGIQNRLSDYCSSQSTFDSLSLWTWFESLSSGEKQKVSLSLVLSSSHQLLLLDEPESHLDQSSLGTLIHILKQRSSAQILVVVSHHHDLLSIADHHVELS